MSDENNDLPPQAPQFSAPGEQPAAQQPQQQQGQQQFVPPPAKSGMGTGAKVAIGCVILFVLALLASCGVSALLWIADNDDDDSPSVIEDSTTTTVADTGVRATLDEYNRVASGMTLEEVNAIFGGPGQSFSSFDSGGTKYESYTWDGTGFASSASISFENNKVVSKSQFGLE